ncbi:MAG: S8 family serine peptidase, partial [Acidobacteria bacterium]|nr:S8 family serine peptidase [Acidobacteriota bacterium]
DSGTLPSGNSLFIDWAVLNDGTAPTDTQFLVRLSVDGQEVQSWFADPPLDPFFFVSIEDFELDALSPGTHTLTLLADSTSQIAESNESDNEFAKTITIMEEVPNLTPFRPSGWSAPIVVSTTASTNTDSVSLFSTDRLFIDYAYINRGLGPTTVRFDLALLVDGEEVFTSFFNPPLNPNFFGRLEDVELDPLSVGTHTVTLMVDSTAQIDESDESDNTFTKTITITEGVPNLTPFQPSGWSDRIVVSTTTGSHTDSGTLSSTDSLFVDWAVWNNGTGSTDKRFITSLLLDDQEIQTWFTDPPHKPHFFVFIEDFELGALSPGTHSLKLVADSSLQIEESNETDNEFTRTIEIVPSEEEEPEVITIIFPRVQDDSTFGTGLAIANSTDEIAEVDLFLYEDNGRLKTGTGITNPTTLTISPNEQIARTLTEFFGQGATDINGWIRASSENLGIVGFFITFSQDGTSIDGAEASLFQSSTLIFPEIFTGNDEFTEINLIGSGSIALELYNSDGDLVDTTNVELPSEFPGRFSGRVSEIFTAPIPDSSYVLVSSSQFQIIGYESFGSSRFLGGRNAIPVSGTGRNIPLALFGAQVADTAVFQSTVTIINPTDAAALLTLSAFQTGVSSGTPVGSATLSLDPKSMVKADSRSLLNLPAGDFVGWIRIDSTISGIVGDVTFGDPEGEFLSSVQLQSSPVRDVVFSHVADGSGFLTGITFLNPSSDPAAISVEVFNTEGQRTGVGNFVLQSFEHRPRLLSEIVSNFQPQIGGFIRVQSDHAIYTFELFSFIEGQKLVSLAAVPPQRGHGTVTGRVIPAFVSESSQEAQSGTAQLFEASRAKGIRLDLDAEFVPGEVVVKLHPQLGFGDVLIQLARGEDLRILASGADGLHLVQTAGARMSSPLAIGPPGQADSLQLKRNTLALVEELNSRPEILYAEPNYIYHALAIPNDTHYGLQWHYSNINLPAAWDITTGDSNIIIAVIDTGAKFNHPDLGPRLTGGQYDFISDLQNALDGDGIDPVAEDPGNNPSDFSSSFHGTHVAGTIGAVTNNGQGVAGVNWVSPLMTLRVLGSEGGTNFDISQAILYAAGLSNSSGRLPAQKANVINMSLGGESLSRTMGDAVAAALAENVVVVAAAGNDNSDVLSYPASYDGVISVGATYLDSGKSPYSSFGPRIDIVAPGGDNGEDENADGYRDGVLSTLWDERENVPDFRFYQGTSMASPHVAGVVSLMLSVNPDLTPSQVRQILQETAIDLEQPGRDDTFGYGLIHPVAALQAAGAAAPEDPRLVVSTNVMNFSSSLTQLTATVSNSGGGTLRVNSPTVEVDQGATWLSALLSRNTLIVSVDRNGLSNGSYSGRVRLTSNGGNTTIEVLMDVGGGSENEPEQIFVLALDPATFNTIGGVSTEPAGDFKYRIPPIVVGDYLIAAGTDLDDDGFICDEGEFCGFFPVTNQPTTVQVQSNQITADVVFTVEKDENQPSQSQGLIRREGFKITPVRTNPFEVLSPQTTKMRSVEEVPDVLNPLVVKVQRVDPLEKADN